MAGHWPSTRHHQLAVAYCLFVPLVATALYYVSGLNVFGQLGRVATVVLLCSLVVPLRRRLAGEHLSSVFTFTLLLFACWLVQPFVELLAGSSAAAFRGARWTLYTAIWCAPLWILSVAIHTTDDLRRAVRLVDHLGFAIAGSVYIAAGAYVLDFRIGDVVDTGSVARIFGPLGDMVTFCLLLFLFRELARRNWLRFGFYLFPFFLGRTRGALLALTIGLAAYALTRSASALRRARTGELFLHLGTCLVALTLVGGTLAYTDIGHRLVERFDDFEVRAYERWAGGRFSSLEHSRGTFTHHPIVGAGPGGYQEIVIGQNLAWGYEDRPGGTAVVNRGALATSAQNQLAQIAAESGLVGLATFIPWCIIVLRTGQRATRIADPELQEFMVGGQLFLVSVLLGTQTASYLADKSSIALLLCFVAALAERACRAPAATLASVTPRVARRHVRTWSSLAPTRRRHA
jgi:hypothetical protein